MVSYRPQVLRQHRLQVNRPSSKEILDYLYRGRTDTQYFGKIDTSRPEWNNGVTNIYMKDVVGSRWTRVHGGWYFLGYDNTDVEAIALNDEGYLLADTVTPDGYYVNKRGVLEIDGREVTHCEECIYIASSIDVPDKNHVDLSKYNDWEIGIGHSWRMSSFPYGKLIYNHVTGMDREQGGIGSNIVSHNDFGVCAVGDAENSYKHTKNKQILKQTINKFGDPLKQREKSCCFFCADRKNTGFSRDKGRYA